MILSSSSDGLLIVIFPDKAFLDKECSTEQVEVREVVLIFRLRQLVESHHCWVVPKFKFSMCID
jgi:hypothetical protein